MTQEATEAGSAMLGADRRAAPSSELFVRDASGLVREIGTRDAVAIGLGTVNFGTGLTVLVLGLALFPQSDLVLPMILGALATVFLALAYAQLTATLPRAGGDYIFVSRILHPVVGAILGVGLLGTFFFGIGGNTLIWSQLFLPFLFQGLGDAFGISAFTSFSQTLASSHHWQFGMGVLVIALVAVVALTGVRAVTRATFAVMVFGIVAFVILILQFLFHDAAAFQRAFDEASGHGGAYREVIAAAASGGLQTNVTLGASLSAVSLMALIWFGTTYPAITGGELKRPGRTMLNSQLFTIGASLVGFVVVYLAWKHAAGFRFLQSATWLSVNQPDAYAKISSIPTFVPALGLLVSGDPVTKLVMALGFPALNLVILFVLMLVTSRLIFGLAFDRLLPGGLAAVRAGANAPVAAIILASIGGVVFLAGYVYSSSISAATRNAVLIAAAGFVVVALAGAVLPYRRRDLYAAAPKVFGERWLGLPSITVVSVIAGAIFALLGYLVATKSSVSGGYDTTSLLTLFGTPALGLVFFVVSRLYLRRRGVDIALAMRELPPD
jgi:amino acid transporter